LAIFGYFREVEDKAGRYNCIENKLSKIILLQNIFKNQNYVPSFKNMIKNFSSFLLKTYFFLKKNNQLADYYQFFLIVAPRVLANIWLAFLVTFLK
jgi:hypothetical protein